MLTGKNDQSSFVGVEKILLSATLSNMTIFCDENWTFHVKHKTVWLMELGDENYKIITALAGYHQIFTVLMFLYQHIQWLDQLQARKTNGMWMM